LAKAAIRIRIRVLFGDQPVDRGGNRAGGHYRCLWERYIDVASAITIGMLPSLSPNRLWQVGNAVSMGAKSVLISRHKGASYTDLASAPDFRQTFIQAGHLGKYRLSHEREKR
jgi:uncharacterized 2Fe-2S/4Fe-4S cluster protein (DUF4445 family)